MSFSKGSQFGFRVRMEKGSFAKKIMFLGNLISKDGRRPDPEKIHAIVEMPPPKDMKQLKSFLVMISFYSSFVQEMRSMRGLLDDLENKNKLSWTAEHLSDCLRQTEDGATVGSAGHAFQT